MGTFLTTRKMKPELAARVEARLSGRRKAPGKALSPLIVSGLRFGALAVVIAVTAVFVLGRQQYKRQLEQARGALLERVQSDAAALTEDDFRTVARAEAWLTRAAGPYQGDLIAAELRASGAFSTLLKRPAIYVRGELVDFTSPAALRATAADSRKDPFLLCLIDPPESREEKAQLRKVFAAYAGGARVETPTPQVRRLAEAHLGLSFLAPAWRSEIETANNEDELQRLKQGYAQAPIDAAKRAAKARLLLYAMDEPGTGNAPIELDGERPHPVRVGIVDLATDKVVLRLRKNVDPAWISAAKRADYARGLDGCALALDVHDSVKGPAPVANSVIE